MNPSFPVRALLAAIALAVLSACQTVPPAPTPAPEKTVSDAVILSALETHQSAVHSVRAFVKTQIRTPFLNHTLRQTVIARNDQSIRLDTLSAFGQPLGVFIFKPGHIQIYDPQKNQVHTGAEAWYMMSDLFGTWFDFGEFINVFLGKVPRFDKLEVRGITAEGAPVRYVLDAHDPFRKERYRIVLNGDTLRPVEMTQFKNLEKVYHVVWSQSKPVGAISFPHQVTVQRFEQGDEVILNYRNPQVNPAIPDTAFELFPERSATP